MFLKKLFVRFRAQSADGLKGRDFLLFEIYQNLNRLEISFPVTHRRALVGHDENMQGAEREQGGEREQLEVRISQVGNRAGCSELHRHSQIKPLRPFATFAQWQTETEFQGRSWNVGGKRGAKALFIDKAPLRHSQVTLVFHTR